MYLRGNFPLRCNLELSGPDFPFSINQDPSYPPTWGKTRPHLWALLSACQGTEVSRSWTLQSPPFIWKGSALLKGQGPSQELGQPCRVAFGLQQQRGLEMQRSSRDSHPRWPRFRPRTVKCLGPQFCRWETRTGPSTGRPWTTQAPRGSVRWTRPRGPHAPSVGRAVTSWTRHRWAESPGLNKCLKNKAQNNQKDFPYTELKAEKSLFFSQHPPHTHTHPK